ncbi:MAG: hypothetical protein QXL77_06855 [Candidatus Bathyarchaeia archaeon]|nr:hypothetical protein [Candidatus Bathyarchaeota archaeon]
MNIEEQEFENEEEWVSKIAKKLVDSKMDGVALLFLESIGPTSHVWSQLARLYFQPLFILIGPDSEKLLAFAEKPENIEKLVKKIEEYQIQKEEEKKREKAEKKRKFWFFKS